MDLRPTGLAGWGLFLILAISSSGCASGPPGTMVPGTGHTLHTHAPLPEARLVSEGAQAFLEEVGGYLRLRPPPGGLLRIYHYPNRWALWWHLNREAPSLRWRKGVCYETEEAYVVTLCGNPERERFQEALRHELTHYLVAVHFRDIPPWIDEGLAQVLASGPPFPHLEEDRLEAACLEARRRKERGCLQLLTLPAGKKLSPSQYRVACALTYYLLTRSPETAPTQLVRFLETSQPGVPATQKFSSCWGISTAEACGGLLASIDWEPGARGRGARVRRAVR
jgi:hypothetical protein